MSLDDLQAQLRGALDQQFAALKQHYEGAIAEARQQATLEAQRVAERRIAEARAEADAHVEQLVAGARAEAEQRLREAAAVERHSLERQLRQQFDQELHDAVAAAQADAERRSREAAALERQAAEQQLRLDLEQQQQQLVEQAVATARRSAELERESERRRAQSEFDQERERLTAELDAERGKVAAQGEQIATQGEQIAAERERTAAEREQIIAERERIAGERDAERSRASAEIERIRHEAEAEIEAAKQALAAVPPPLAAPPANLSRLAEAIRDLDTTRTLSEALDTLNAHAGSLAGRSALFVINGDRLQSWKSVGIPEVDVRSVESLIGGRDLLACAIQAGHGVPASADAPAPPFARAAAERAALAVPVMIGGRAVAVLYVDPGTDAAQPATAGAFQMVEALARHASTVVALRTAMRTLDVLRGVSPEAAGNGSGEVDEQSARRFARLLVSEIKLYNEAAVRAGRQQRDLLQRLRPEIDRARRLYEERVPPTIGARHAFFQQELEQTLADGDPALLGNS